VFCALNGKYAGYVLVADEPKADAAEAVKSLNDLGMKQIVMLSGDKQAIVSGLAEKLGIAEAHGDLLPEGKARHIERLKKNPANSVAFVGDGINDAPVLALSDVGIAMGGLGSDMAIETADVIIQTDEPGKIAIAIKIGEATRKIVVQNITLAFAIKLIILTLGAAGLASLWAAVFADVGTALIAIFNAIRILKMRF
ncbi:MAG: HAD-IC family P-type ATPase, partial [Dysgonamonadaceae bacterium]|jgi:Cd2+/Zn2+-exporting ATPase|nr:HAD-IC family P-type ATPase [Dysgonamonadaceae bacterium]